jgi:hypothetical protein
VESVFDFDEIAFSYQLSAISYPRITAYERFP